MHVNANVPLCKIIFVPPKLGGGDLGKWDHPGVHTCTWSSATGPVRADMPPPWFNLMMGMGGETGIREGHQSLKSNIHHCRLQPWCRLLHVITADRLALIINLLHHIHFIISPSLTDRWDEPSSKWQGNWDKVNPFKVYPLSRSEHIAAITSSDLHLTGHLQGGKKMVCFFRKYSLILPVAVHYN